MVLLDARARPLGLTLNGAGPGKHFQLNPFMGRARRAPAGLAAGAAFALGLAARYHLPGTGLSDANALILPSPADVTPNICVSIIGSVCP